MMRYRSIAACAAFIAGLLLGGQVVAEETNFLWKAAGKYHDNISGTNVSSIVDTNGDGVPGNLTVMKGYSTWGPVTVTTFSEFNPRDAAPTPRCRGMIEFPMLEDSSSVIIRFLRGDMLFLKTDKAMFCLDPATGYYEFTNSSVVVGGTGRFRGATGRIDAEGNGGSLSFDQTGILHFGWVDMSNKGTINRQPRR